MVGTVTFLLSAELLARTPLDPELDAPGFVQAVKRTGNKLHRAHYATSRLSTVAGSDSGAP